MASKKKGGLSKTELKDLAQELENAGYFIRQELSLLDGYMSELQKGDGSKSYWSGERAYAWIESVLKHMDNDETKADKLTAASGAVASMAKASKNL